MKMEFQLTAAAGALIGGAVFRTVGGALSSSIGAVAAPSKFTPTQKIVSAVAFAALNFATRKFIVDQPFIATCFGLLPILAVRPYAALDIGSIAMAGLFGNYVSQSAAQIDPVTMALYSIDVIGCVLVGAYLSSLATSKSLPFVATLLAAGSIFAQHYRGDFNPYIHIGLVLATALIGVGIKANFISQTKIPSKRPRGEPSYPLSKEDSALAAYHADMAKLDAKTAAAIKQIQAESEKNIQAKLKEITRNRAAQLLENCKILERKIEEARVECTQECQKYDAQEAQAILDLKAISAPEHNSDTAISKNLFANGIPDFLSEDQIFRLFKCKKSKQCIAFEPVIDIRELKFFCIYEKSNVENDPELRDHLIPLPKITALIEDRKKLYEASDNDQPEKYRLNLSLLKEAQEELKRFCPKDVSYLDHIILLQKTLIETIERRIKTISYAKQGIIESFDRTIESHKQMILRNKAEYEKCLKELN